MALPTSLDHKRYHATISEDLSPEDDPIFDYDPTLEASFFDMEMERKRCTLLGLPLEIRSQIFGYIFKLESLHNRSHPGRLFWVKGSRALLSVSKQVHDEAAVHLYGTAVFSIDKFWDFVEPSILPYVHGIEMWHAYRKGVGKRYLPLIRNLDLGIHTGFINILLTRLRHGAILDPVDRLRFHVKAFFTVLRNVPEVRRLCLYFDDPFCFQILRETVQSFSDLGSILHIEVEDFIASEVREKLMRWQAHIKAAGVSATNSDTHTNSSHNEY